MADEAFGDVTNYVRQHPVMVGGVAIGIVAGIFLLRHAAASSTAPAGYAAQTNPAYLALTQQQMQITAQANAQQGQENYGVALATIQQQTTNTTTAGQVSVALSQIAEQAKGVEASLQVALTQAADTAATQQRALDVTLAQTQSNNDTQIAIASTAANEQTQIANIQAGTSQAQLAATTAIAGINAAVQTAIARNQADTSIAISNNQTTLGVTQSNNFADVAKAQIKGQTTQSGLGILGGVLGAFL